MISEKFNLYWVLYVYILENFFIEESEGFNQFAGDANPFIWEEQSWDPSLFEDFLKVCTDSLIKENEEFLILKKFLLTLDDIYADVKSIADTINVAEFYERIHIISLTGFKTYSKRFGLQK